MAIGRVSGPPDFSYTTDQVARLEELFRLVEAKTITWVDPNERVPSSNPPPNPEEQTDKKSIQ
jgi:hypothetical protein